MPVGVTMTKGWILERVYPSLDRAFVHGGTFMGNALAMAAGLATVAVIEELDLIAHAERTGTKLIGELRRMADRYDLIADVRGRGLMVGIEFGPSRRLGQRLTWHLLRAARRGLFAQLVVAPLFQRHRVLTQVAGDHIEVIKLLPPLLIGDEEIAWFLSAFDEVLADAHKGNRLLWEFGTNLIGHALTRR